MKKKFLLNIIILLLTFASSYAQIEKANKLYDNKEYLLAIEQYKKVLKNNESNEAIEKLANSYRLVKDFPQAEIFYLKLSAQASANPINRLYYGMVLKNNNKIEEAKTEFKAYAALVPNNKKTKSLIKLCDDIIDLGNKQKEFEVVSVTNFNTVQSEFSPVFFKNSMVFISDLNQNLFNNEQNLFHVYSANEIKRDPDNKPEYAKKKNLLPWPINTDGHDGPVSFNTEQNLMIITHSDLNSKKDKKFINRSKLYFSTLIENNWSKLKPFQYNSDEYSVAHASISFDGKKLFFSSDMPGGKGGMDIYFCEKNEEGWGIPVNLGDKVNTESDEVFPYIRKDGVLFFSSDEHAGFGNLDIFSSKEIKGKYASVKNLGAQLNSSGDDFGIIFFDDNITGYFSSNRANGYGSDDIYSFTALNTNTITLSGKIVMAQNINFPLKNNAIELLSENGKTLMTSNTDNLGFFKFENVNPKKKYKIKIDDTNPAFNAKAKYYLADDKETFIRETNTDINGENFIFKNLPANPNALPEISSEGITFAGNLLYGAKPTMPVANIKVDLLNEKQEIVQTTFTNEFGAFLFTHLPSEQNFLIKVDENDTKLAKNNRIVLTNKSGKEIKETVSGNIGDFKFTFLAADKTTLKLMTIEDTELRIDFKGKILSENNKPIANSIVNLVNDKGEILQSVKTDEFGTLVFTNLPADQNLLFLLDEHDTQLKKSKVVILSDLKGVKVKEFNILEGVFKLALLPSDKQKLGLIYFNDPWLNVLKLKTSPTKEALIITERIYYDYSKYAILPEAEKVLDKVVNIMEKNPLLKIEISSFTDSRSSSETNMELSSKRANTAVNYIIKNGIPENRISGKGYGETQLINNCGNDIKCSEEEHAKNRRTEFKVSKKE